MTDEELLDGFAMFRASTGATPKECYEFAREALKVRNADPEEEVGLPPIKRTRKVKSD